MPNQKPTTRIPHLTKRQVRLGFYVLAIVLCLVVYGGILGSYLYNDDFVWMSAARYEMNTGNVLSYRVIGFFRPVVNLAFFVTERLAPGGLSSYYYTNLLLHFLCSVTLFHLTWVLFRKPFLAAGTGLYFLVTSMHTSAVIWISARTTLLSTLFLLLSLFFLVWRDRNRWHAVLSLVLYTLALYTKETATVGLVLAGLVWWLTKGREKRVDGRVLIGFAAVTAVYLLNRYLAIGGFAQENWGPGPHVLRNLAGGVLFEFYPWSLAALSGVGTTLAESGHSVWPEILVLPLLGGLLWAAWKLERLRAMGFAVLWILVCLTPASFFKFRFFSTAMRTQDRYYYLSSAGVCLAVALLLWAVWQMAKARSAVRAALVAAAIVLFGGEIVNVQHRLVHWHTVTGNYRTIVSLVEKRLDETAGLSTCVLGKTPMRFRYLEDALRLEHPDWTVVQAGSEEEARRYAPCLQVRFAMRGGQIATVGRVVR